MNNQNLIIYDFNVLYEILNEINIHLNFKIINLSKNQFSKGQLNNYDNFLIISQKKISNLENQIILDDFPLRLNKLIENINVRFLKKKFNQQSDIDLGLYKLNLNSRKIFSENNSLDLTEKEISIIVFLKNLDKPANISQLQKEVWGHNSKLDTHTVETHIYRLRKKIKDTFKDNNFIKSSKLGYIVN